MSIQEDNWLWKMEPQSPFSSTIDDTDDYNLYYDDKTSSSLDEPTEKVLYDETPSRAQVATKLLEELDEYIKEEPFSDWLEEKVEFLFEDIPSPECGQNKPTIYSTPGKQETTQLLLQEFETVLGDVEACHQIYPSNSSLTPPQTPPPSLDSEKLSIDTQLLVTLHPLLQIDSTNSLTETIAENSDQPIKTPSYLQQISGGWNAENISLTLPLANNVASELAEVDEYVRSCAEDMSPSTPSSSSNSCYSSEDSNDDPDWTTVKSAPSKLRNQRIAKNRSSSHKPYSRPTVEDKKVRKKEQNKNAATRYRQKKKLEIKEIVGEEQELADYNEKLHDQVKELKREVGYLKGLMRDLFKAKGLIK